MQFHLYFILLVQFFFLDKISFKFMILVFVVHN